jgi:hypothetical protein
MTIGGATTAIIRPPARPPVRPLLLAALALLASGCLVAPGSTPSATSGTGAQALPFPDPMGQDHDHSDVTLHANSYHFEMTDHQPLAGSPTHSSGAHALSARAGWLFAAVYGGEADAEGGVFVFNVSDPAHPRLTGRLRMAGALGGDRSMEATEDAQFVVLGTEPVDCAGHVAPAGPGLWLIDVRDKANPIPVDYLPSTGVHSVTIHRIHGEDYVFGLMPDQNVIHIDKSGPKPRLVPVGQLPIGHDSVVMDDPLLGGRPLLYASNGGGGFEIWDVSTPSAPQRLAGWNIPNRPAGKYYVHTGAVSFLDGKRIAVVTSEDWGDYPSAMWVLDATNLSYIETLSQWSAPGAHAADGLRYSMHNPRFDGSVLDLAYYHGGVWSLDLSTDAHRAQPFILGQYEPNVSNGWRPQPTETHAVSDELCGAFHLADAPLVFDVEPGKGVLYVADLPTGLYTLKPTW